VTISAFGGAGPVHAYGLAKKIGAPRIIVPPLAGVGRPWVSSRLRSPSIFPAVSALTWKMPISARSRRFSRTEREAAAILEQADRRPRVTFERTS